MNVLLAFVPAVVTLEATMHFTLVVLQTFSFRDQECVCVCVCLVNVSMYVCALV